VSVVDPLVAGDVMISSTHAYRISYSGFGYNVLSISGGIVTVDAGGLGATFGGTLGVTGAFTPGQTTGIVGTTTNNNAQAGSVGEYVESVVANVSFTTSGGPGNNITSISLTAGDWDVSLTCIIENNGATITTSQITTSKYSGADNTDRVYGSNWIYTYLTGSIGGTISPYRVSVSSSQTVYAKWAWSYSAGTPYMNCRLSARRVR